jgi:hypothetical protein
VSNIGHVETSTPNTGSTTRWWEISTKITSFVRFCILGIFRNGIQTDRNNYVKIMDSDGRKKLAQNITLAFVRCPL